MHTAILNQVLEVNAGYYDAFARGDMEATLSYWSDRDATACIPPVGQAGYGRDGVEGVYRDSFAALGGRRFTVTVMQAVYDDPVATITCAERIHNADPDQVTDLLATNVYLLEAIGWRMVHHHASWRATAGSHPLTAIRRLERTTPFSPRSPTPSWRADELGRSDPACGTTWTPRSR